MYLLEGDGENEIFTHVYVLRSKEIICIEKSEKSPNLGTSLLKGWANGRACAHTQEWESKKIKKKRGR